MGGRKKQAKNNTRISRVLVLSFIDTNLSVAAILALFSSINFPELVVLRSILKSVAYASSDSARVKPISCQLLPNALACGFQPYWSAEGRV